MAETKISRVIEAPRTKVYEAIADVQTLAKCLQPTRTTSRVLGYDAERGSLRMEITHAPGPEGTRRFHLEILEARPEELVVYGSAFETEDPMLAGEMKLYFALEDAPGGTRVTVRHEGLPAGISVQENELGTASSLANLARLVEGRRADG